MCVCVCVCMHTIMNAWFYDVNMLRLLFPIRRNSVVRKPEALPAYKYIYL